MRAGSCRKAGQPLVQRELGASHRRQLSLKETFDETVRDISDRGGLIVVCRRFIGNRCSHSECQGVSWLIRFRAVE